MYIHGEYHMQTQGQYLTDLECCTKTHGAEIVHHANNIAHNGMHNYVQVALYIVSHRYTKAQVVSQDKHKDCHTCYTRMHPLLNLHAGCHTWIHTAYVTHRSRQADTQYLQQCHKDMTITP